MTPSLPAVVLSAHTTGLGVIRSLGRMGIPVVSVYYNKRDMGFVSNGVAESVLAPHPEREEDLFLEVLIEVAKRWGRGLLIPADDATLIAVSRHKRMLEKDYIVACTDWEITETFIDKKRTYALADRMGVAIPKTVFLKSSEDAERAGDTVEYPAVVKPCIGHRYQEQFGEKLVRVESVDQMIFAVRRAHEAGLEVMLQELIPGDDTQGINYNSYFWDGAPLVEFTARKVRLSPPDFGVPSVVVSQPVPEVLEPGRKFLRAMGYSGYSCTEFKRDPRDGVYKLMETNGRHNRSTLLATRCGVNFPWIEYRHRVRGELPVASSFAEGVYWIDEFQDSARLLAHPRRKNGSFPGYFRPYSRPHVFAVFHVSDLRPFAKRCAGMAGIALERIRERARPGPDAPTLAKADRGKRSSIQSGKAVSPEDPFYTFLGVKIDNLAYRGILEKIRGSLREKGYICLTEAGTVIAASEDEELREAIGHSLISIPDGMPLVWYGKLLGSRRIERISGMELMKRLLKEENGWSHYLLGDTEETISRVIEKASRANRNLRISGHSPPFKDVFDEEDNRLMLEKVNAADPDIVWVSFGGRKQNQWMCRNIRSLNRGVMIGVGAAFRFYTGDLWTPPKIVQAMGLQWFFRMVQEPRRWFRTQARKKLKFALHFPIEVYKGRNLGG